MAFYPVILYLDSHDGTDGSCPIEWHWDDTGTGRDTATSDSTLSYATTSDYLPYSGTHDGDDDVAIYEVSDEHLSNVRGAYRWNNLRIAKLKRDLYFVRYRFNSRATET